MAGMWSQNQGAHQAAKQHRIAAQIGGNDLLDGSRSSTCCRHIARNYGNALLMQPFLQDTKCISC